MSIILNPFQLLEINVISAQDLAPVCRSMRTYAVAWVHPNRRLSTRVDTHGHCNPTWNDKFVFRVDDQFLLADTSAVMIQIYAQHWFRDVHVGTVRVLVGNLVSLSPSRPHQPHHQQPPSHVGMRFVALQVRRPSGRPQGILNIGVALLDSSMRSVPLYTQLSSAVGYRDLMGEDDPQTHNHGTLHHHRQNNSNTNVNGDGNADPTLYAGPQLRRTRSERSERVSDVEFQRQGSIINGSDAVKGGKASSMINGSEVGKAKRGKASSLVSGSEAGKVKTRKAGSIINGSDIMDTPGEKKSGKASSIINGSEVKGGSKEHISKKAAGSVINGSDMGDPPEGKAAANEKANKPISKTSGPDILAQLREPVTYARPITNYGSVRPFAKVDFAAHPKVAYPYGNGSVVSESEVGPSASEVAAAVAEGMYPVAHGRNLDKWSLDGSVEGLRSKLERWRTELPPVYDKGEFESYPSSDKGGGGGGGGSSRRARRHSDGGGGLFSCFGNVYGYECSCSCGRPTGPKKSGSGRMHPPASSIVTESYI
ncbi:uncharacterized protein LOC131151276 [Malania oleifera]|uniref:uncharacterized protein LOC131151276 n=1 Tax=Malania oleifera TaxID=397392 RepID=UPI0025ADD861|nr:uncharacterized protein LOC131151276 [Malania oleifera]